MSAPSLPVFLLQRLDEDEAATPEVGASIGGRCAECGGVGAERWEAEVEAKRRIVEGILDATMDGRESRMIGPFMSTDDILGLLALPYADHEDYRAEWKV